MNPISYSDNAATSWPKPEEVPAAMTRYLCGIGGSPGRSGHRLSIEAGRIVPDAREVLAKIFGVWDPFRIVFTKNATEALTFMSITSPLHGFLDTYQAYKYGINPHRHCPYRRFQTDYPYL
jgi:selenocysteine lyase/cysteine desulfurase